jgi:hypothetical protein
MVRAASGTRFWPANPVASIRLEGLLVRAALSHTVRKNRGVMEWQNQLACKGASRRDIGDANRTP